jgi:hypothetical protein
MTSIKDFVDENDLDAVDVIDALDIDPEQFVDDRPEEPHDFYDGEPDVEQLADDFDAVAAMQSERESLEATVDSLEADLREYEREDFTDKAEELAELTGRDADELTESFDEGELTIDELDDKLEVARQAVSSSTTTSNSGSSEETSTGTYADGARNESERDYETTNSGKLVLNEFR